MPEGEVRRRTLVVFLLDHTGSMVDVRDQTINAVNAYLEALKAEGDLLDLTFIVFNHIGLRLLEDGTPIRDVEKLSYENYLPRGADWHRSRGGVPHFTVGLARRAIPLIDAVYSSIVMVECTLERRNDHPKVVFCIHVDGMEGSSTHHTWGKLRAAVEDKIAQGWQFNFLGAGALAYEHAILMGIPASHTMEYARLSDKRRSGGVELFIDNAGGETRKVLLVAAQNAMVFARGDRKSTAFNALHRAKVGDRFPLAAAEKISANLAEAESEVRSLLGIGVY